ncbi:MAG TPA: acyl carrier protein [Caldisericia bacterium]|jgi:acyl carrier protein|nr:acyl carrier protein [Caldisericia bacterium]MCE5176573.1 acyl carrier protein [bacterium]NLI40363.1 acyl carrier protein [Caldisericales bacterium]NMD14271.1 acyl carrier protein [Caldisericales bacterium]HNY61365.1 acyl carrier protein [Caldisericia bacterium]
MNTNEIFEQMKDIIVEKLGVEKDKIKMESKFMDDLGADSLGLVDVTMELEEKFGVSIPDEDLPKITTVASAVDYVQKKLS